MTALNRNRKHLCLVYVMLFLLVFTACHSEAVQTESTNASTVGTEPTTEPTSEPQPASTDPTEPTTAPTEPSTELTAPIAQGPVFDVDTLPAYEGEVMTNDASIPVIVNAWEEDNTSIRYYTEWDITNGTLSPMQPCFSHLTDNYNVFIDYWDGEDVLWLNESNAITALDSRTYLERPNRSWGNGNSGLCRHCAEEEKLYRIDENGELAELPLPPVPNAASFGFEYPFSSTFYTHYDGERILMIYYQTPNSHSSFTLVYGFYTPDAPEAVQWKTLTLNGEYMDVTFTNFQACYCDGLLYIPSYDNLYIIDLETEKAWRIAEINGYTSLVSESERDGYPCVKIIGCYNDIVVARLSLKTIDGNNQCHELAIRKGRIIGSYSRTIQGGTVVSLTLHDENGAVLFSDDELASKIANPTFPRVD